MFFSSFLTLILMLEKWRKKMQAIFGMTILTQILINKNWKLINSVDVKKEAGNPIAKSKAKLLWSFLWFKWKSKISLFVITENLNYFYWNFTVFIKKYIFINLIKIWELNFFYVFVIFNIFESLFSNIKLFFHQTGLLNKDIIIKTL